MTIKQVNILLPLVVIIVFGKATGFAQLVGNGTSIVGPELCQDNLTEGYIDIETLNNDMLANAMNGIIWEEYTICPNSKIRFKSGSNKNFITPVHNALIKCGNYGNSKENCSFVGGDHHVIIYPDLNTLFFVEFRGFTFIGNKDISICSWGNPGMSVVFTDCLFQNNVGSTIIDSYYSSDRRKMRKLSESGTLTDIHNNLLQQLGEKQDGNNIFEENKDDISSEYQSMNVAFSSCYFKNNNQAIGIAFTIGGYIEFSNAQFLDNIVGVSMIGVTGGAKLIIHSNSKFYNNTNGISSAYVNHDSIIEIVDNTNLSSMNTGYKCNDIFIENSTSKCLVLGMYVEDCFGQCCRFGNEVHNGKDEPIICR